MIYYKILYLDNRIGFYASVDPLFVKYQETHNIIIRCKEREAQGIVSPDDNDTICILDGKELRGYSAETSPIAYIISQGEYEEYVLAQEQTDVEDETPVVPENVPEETILTRAELTRRITELEAQNEFLQDCILEMSEAIYG